MAKIVKFVSGQRKGRIIASHCKLVVLISETHPPPHDNSLQESQKKRCGHSPAHHCSTQNQSTLRHKNDTTPQSAKAMPLLFTLQVWLATWFNAARTSREFDQQPVGPRNSATLRICNQVPAAYKGISCNRCILLFYHRMTSTSYVFTAGKPPKSLSMGLCGINAEAEFGMLTNRPQPSQGLARPGAL